MENWTNAKYCDVANLVLGAILLVSPWIFGFGTGAATNSVDDLEHTACRCGPGVAIHSYATLTSSHPFHTSA